MRQRIWIVLCAMITTAGLRSEVPYTMQFHAVITDPLTHNPVSGTYSTVFTIYDAPAGGGIVWTETQNVTLAGGNLDVLLGRVNSFHPYVFQSPERYLGIRVGSYPETTPRQQFASVPYAMAAEGPFFSATGTSKFCGGGEDHAVQIWQHGATGTPPSGGVLQVIGDQATLVNLSTTTGCALRGSISEGQGIYMEAGGGIAITGRSMSGYGTPPDVCPGIGVKGEGKDYGGYFIGGLITNPSDHLGIGGYFEGPKYAGLFKGMVHVKGVVTQEYGTGDETRATPVAYGNVRSNGSLSSGTPNLTTGWDAVRKGYWIAIRDQLYVSSAYVTTVTPIRTQTVGLGHSKGDVMGPVDCETSSGDGKLVVMFFDSNGNAVQHNFQFVTYKP
jgi:hypothetical protein